MNNLRFTGLIGAAALAVLCVSPAAQSAGAPRDGQHDFLGGHVPERPIRL
jgi:hypothetical protein